MKLAILDTDNLGWDLDYSLFEQFGQVCTFAYTESAQLAAHAAGCAVLIFNKLRIDAAALDKLPDVRLLCVCATGYDNVDIEACRARGVAVCNVPAYSTQSVAQHTFALLLSLIHHVPYYDDFVKTGVYTASGRQNDLSRTYEELCGKRWGIIGMGQIGQRVAQIASAFGCHVCYYSTANADRAPAYERVGLEQLLQECDIVSIHSPKTEKTNAMIGKEQLKMMKETALLINVGRGGIVQEQALAQALRDKWIRGAALDVFEKEPLQEDSPLLAEDIAPSLILSPHIAWASVDSRRRLMVAVAENIASFLRGDIKNRVDKDA